MQKFINLLDEASKRISENLARKVDRTQFLKVILGSIFAWLTAFVLNPIKGFAASTTWCEVWSGITCHPPNGIYCSGCTSSSKCPSGRQVSYAWGYQSTGCWCASGDATYDLVCCDCTYSYNNPYQTYSSDCGCGYAVNWS